MKKRIFLYAYTFDNLGDDLFIKVICERYPHTGFLLFAPERYKETFHDIPNLQIIPSDSFLLKGINYLGRLCGQLSLVQRYFSRRCDAVVYIGGSLFIQNENWIKQFKVLKAQQLEGKPFFLIGANFGPYEDKNFLIHHMKLFKTYTDICFRDNYSYELFKELPNVRQAPDVIFQLTDTMLHKDANLVVISVIKPSIRKGYAEYDEVYYQSIKELTTYFIDQGYDVSLVAFCEYEGDHEAVKEILAILPDDYSQMVQTHYYNHNLNETLTLLSKSTYIIASRFHAMVLAWVYHKPVFPIIYSEKMTNVIRDVNFNGEYIQLKTVSNMNPQAVSKSLKTKNVLQHDLTVKSEEQFLLLDQFINE